MFDPLGNLGSFSVLSTKRYTDQQSTNKVSATRENPDIRTINTIKILEMFQRARVDDSIDNYVNCIQMMVIKFKSHQLIVI
jgi:hypothetical protein